MLLVDQLAAEQRRIAERLAGVQYLVHFRGGILPPGFELRREQFEKQQLLAPLGWPGFEFTLRIDEAAEFGGNVHDNIVLTDDMIGR